MKTQLEASLFIQSHRDTLPPNDLQAIKVFLSSIGILEEEPHKIPQVQKLPSIFLTWYKTDHQYFAYSHIVYSLDSISYRIGIIRYANRRTGDILMYCSCNLDGSDIIVEPHSCHMGYIIEEASQDNTSILMSSLSSIGLTWNNRLNRLETLSQEHGKGTEYWYLDDKLRVIRVIDNGGSPSHLRFLAGNYFTDYGKALIYRKKVSELLKDALVKPYEDE